MQKDQEYVPIQLSVKLPPKKIRDNFLVIYELEGGQKAVNYLTKYYSIKRMKIIYNPKKVSKNSIACYSENNAYFKKVGLKKSVVLHELYHHLIDCGKIEIKSRQEEKEANYYAKQFKFSFS